MEIFFCEKKHENKRALKDFCPLGSSRSPPLTPPRTLNTQAIWQFSTPCLANASSSKCSSKIALPAATVVARNRSLCLWVLFFWVKKHQNPLISSSVRISYRWIDFLAIFPLPSEEEKKKRTYTYTSDNDRCTLVTTNTPHTNRAIQQRNVRRFFWVKKRRQIQEKCHDYGGTEMQRARSSGNRQRRSNNNNKTHALHPTRTKKRKKNQFIHAPKLQPQLHFHFLFDFTIFWNEKRKNRSPKLDP